jgi:hypothetical protein
LEEALNSIKGIQRIGHKAGLPLMPAVEPVEKVDLRKIVLNNIK